MRRAHHDAVLVGEARVVRVILVEGVVPHRRPEVIAPQAQQELEDVRVEFRVEATELLLRPTGERRRFVIEEDAAVLDSRFATMRAAGATCSTSRLVTGTSAQKYQGETPVCSERPYRP